MTTQPILIAPFKTGLDTSTEPWQAPADSFTVADNVHIFHGYIEKRSGCFLFGTLSAGEPVMGILRYIKSDGTRQTLAFDTKFAYLYNSSTYVFAQLDTAAVLAGGEFDYVVGANWQSSNVVNRLYFTNGLPYDKSLNGIRYFEGDTPTITTILNPSLGGGNALAGGRLVFTLASRLIVLGTYETVGSTTTYNPQRARWCAKQDPANWSDVSAGGGDYADAATGDQIISAQPLVNQLIVYFTNSVWALLPTSDPNKAFRWVRLNSFRACDGKMASVGYDRYSKALGIRGITATDGTETQRIDQKILTFTSEDINASEFGKVFCERSYNTQRWWTLYPSTTSGENDKALVYDDISGAFTTYSIALNCLGQGVVDYSMEISDPEFTDWTLQDFGNDTLQDYAYDQNQDVLLGGDLIGNVYQLESGSSDLIGTVEVPIESTIITAKWNPFQAEGREALLNYVDFYVDTDNTTTMLVEFFKNDGTNPYATQEVKFMPNLDFIADINQIDKTNPCIVHAASHGLSTGDTVYIYGVLGMTDINSGNGYAVTVVDENSFSLDGIDATGFSAYVGGGSVYSKEFYQTKAWIRAYGGGIGYIHWLRLTVSGTNTAFKIHAIKTHFKPRGKRTIN